MFKTEILADSINPQGDRITTMKVTFPRFILAEFNTHRMFSRNSASSRAIPFNKMVKMVEENPFIPIAWQKDHKGMQGSNYITDEQGLRFCKKGWLMARDAAVMHARGMNEELEVTKQLCNRLLEPFMWHTVIVTSTEWSNFFELRCPQYQTPVSGDGFYFKSKKDCITNHSNPDNLSKLENMSDLEWLQINKSQAEIHIQAIAELMWDAYNESTPKQLQAGEWHIPFDDNIDYEKLGEITSDYYFNNPNEIVDVNKWLTKIATARCARISYETLGDNPKIDYEADIKLHDALKAMEHWSPFEHVARAMSNEEYESYYRGRLKFGTELESGGLDILEPELKDKGWCRNFKGFIQYRSLVDGNNT